jgi:hypothetical protein
MAVLAAAALILTGCSSAPEDTAPPDPNVSLTPVSGTAGLKQVTLSQIAIARLGLRTQPIVKGTPEKIPFNAVIYDPNGKSWTYTSPAARTFVRSAITIDHIDGDTAVLSAGPPAGTAVVTAGAPELLGAEYGVGEE